MKRQATLLTAFVLSALTLSGCSISLPHFPGSTVQQGGTDAGTQSSQSSQVIALEKYVQSERDTIPAQLAQYPGVYSTVSVDASGDNTVVYTYVYAVQKDATVLAPGFDGLAETMQTDLNTQLLPAMRSAGLQGVLYAKYIYLNADGSAIWERVFTLS